MSSAHWIVRVLPSQAYPVRGLCRLDAVQRHSQRQLGVRKFDRGEVLKGSEPLYQIGGRGAASFPGGGVQTEFGRQRLSLHVLTRADHIPVLQHQRTMGQVVTYTWLSKKKYVHSSLNYTSNIDSCIVGILYSTDIQVYALKQITDQYSV